MSFRAECEKKWVRCVEELLEKDITEEQLLKSADILSTAQYADVVEERNIVGLCGYPLCDAPLGPIPKQRYHISVAKKQIYDLTERKKFCSDVCYKSSEFFRSQLSETPLWLRTEPRQVRIQLMSSKDTLSKTDLTRGEAKTLPSNHPKTSPVQTCKTSDIPKAEAIKAKKPSKITSPPATGCGIAIKEKPPLACTETDSGALGPWTATGDSTVVKTKLPKVSQVSKLLNAISTWVSVPPPSATGDRSKQGSHDQSHDIKESGEESQQAREAETLGDEDATQGGETKTEEDTRGSESVMLPPVDSVNVSRIQRTLFNAQLRRHLSTVCSTLHLSLHQILPQVNATTAHFRLTRHCITFRVPEWRIIAVLLIQISCQEAVDVGDGDQVTKWLEDIHATPEDFKLMLASFTPTS